MPLKLKSYRLDDETVEMIRRLARIHGSQGKAIRAGLRALESDAEAPPAAEVIQPRLPAGFEVETISPERAAKLRRIELRRTRRVGVQPGSKH